MRANFRPAHMARYNLTLNPGILIGSMAGPVLAGQLGLRNALLISAGLQAIGGLLLIGLG